MAFSLSTEHDFSVFNGTANEDLETGRVYRTPTGERYASITTLLGKFHDLSGWRNWVGAEKADEITKAAGVRGSIFHDSLEKFVVSGGTHHPVENKKTDRMIQQIEKVLNKDLDCWYGQELAVYSDILRVAGRTDLLGKFRGNDAIIDYKTSMKVKNRHVIEDYFIQTCFYGIALREFTSYKPKKLVILMCADDAPQAQVFIEDFKDWVAPTVKKIQRFHAGDFA